MIKIIFPNSSFKILLIFPVCQLFGRHPVYDKFVIISFYGCSIKSESRFELSEILEVQIWTIIKIGTICGAWGKALSLTFLANKAVALQGDWEN